MEPQTRYAKNGEVHIAYQVVGDGPRDMVHLAGIFSHIELQWEEPSYRRFLERLASFSRLIVLDMRGTGLSDRAAELPLLEHQMDDLSAVLDAVGSDKAAIFAVSQSAPMALLYAATHPQRTSALALYGGYASASKRDGYPWGRSSKWTVEFFRQIDTSWGQGSFLAQVAPGKADDEAFRRWWGRFERYGSAPGNALAYARTHSRDDVRDVLGAISVPTLVMNRADDTYRDPGHSRYLAEHISDAKYVELPGSDHLPYVGDGTSIADEVEEFLTGARQGPPSERVLATVLFTDIVGSTELAARLGDKAWADLLERHNQIALGEIERHRGRVVDSAGDGVLAAFDGPARAIQAAVAIKEALFSLDLHIRAGLHTGEVEMAGGDLRGIAVHIGARVSGLAGPGEVLVSRTVKDLVAGSGIEFEDRGSQVLKGVPDSWQIYKVRD